MVVVVAVGVAAPAVAVVGGLVVVEKIVVADSDDRRGSERSMTEVVAPVSWVGRWLEVEGGQDVLDLMQNWAGKKKVHVSR